MLRIFLLFFCLPAFAQELPLTIKGGLDLNYVYNFNQPRAVAAPTDAHLAQPAGNNTYRVFDLYHDDINVALAELNFAKTQGPLAFFAQLGFGHTAEVMSPRDEVTKNLLQAHVTYTQARWSISAGKMLTHMGLEVAKTRENWNYSRSLLFGYAILLWHTGVAGHYDLIPEKLKGALFVYNETVGLYELGRGKTYGAQLIGTEGDAALTYNFLSGSEISADGVTHQRTLHELIPVLKINERLSLNADVIFGQLSRAKSIQQKNAEWWAWSAGLKCKFGDFYLSPRYEIFTDRSGATIETATSTKPGLPQRISSATLTFAWEVGNGLEARLEARQDRSNAGTFTDHDGDVRSSQTTGTLGMLYDF